METNKIYKEDCLIGLKNLPDNSIDCCVTSPPYFGLRDYGTGKWEGGNINCDHKQPPKGGHRIKSLIGSGERDIEIMSNSQYASVCLKCGAKRIDEQIGLEETPELFVQKLVEVFTEVKRVLKNEGTLWLNLGDSYSGGGKTYGLKPKDLIGIPWLVAKALQAPVYLGKIKKECDRTWMAAMIDGEGTINAFDVVRKDDNRVRTGINIMVTNSNIPLLDRCFEIYPTSRSEHNVHGEGYYGMLPTYRWIIHGIENKILFIKEIYPYLIAKQKQALLAYNLLLLQLDSKRLGKTPMKDSVNSKRQLLASLISQINKANDVEIPDWCIPVDVKSLYEDGWYLRQDIIWHKPNSMPESVTDRCTKSHEYIFLLSKSSKYYYDIEAIKTQMAASSNERLIQDIDNQEGSSRVPGKVNGKMKAVGWKEKKYNQSMLGHKQANGSKGIPSGMAGYGTEGMANKKSVWTVTTKPFSEAHFATFPQDLIVDCIKSGCPEGGIVLDPFMGAGTTALVAKKLNRNYIGFELNPEYIKIAEKRIFNEIGLFM